jgi:hypothetical protein
MRDEGHTRFKAGNYAGAKSAWQKAKKMPDAAKCTDLDALIAKAQAKILPSKPKKPSPEKPATKPTAVKSKPVTKPRITATIASPVAHRKKSGLTMVPVEGDTYTMGGTGSNECPMRCR